MQEWLQMIIGQSIKRNESFHYLVRKLSNENLGKLGNICYIKKRQKKKKMIKEREKRV